MIFPASAADISLNRWILNVTVNEDGMVDELIQVEVANSGPSPLDGISFVVPASNIIVIYDFEHTFSSKGQVVEQQIVGNGIKLTVNFNTSIKTGETWNGRIGFRAENFARKVDGNYSIEIPIDMPQAIIAGKTADIGVSQDADIRSQVFLPKGIEVTSVTPKPFRILFQNSHMVPTWTPENLHMKDTIILKGSFSEILKKIADIDERSKTLSKQIKEAKTKGIDVTESEAYLKQAEDYNTNNANSALSSFWKKDDTSALEFIGYAENELNLAEKSFATSGKTEIKATVKATGETEENNETPGFDAVSLILMIISSFMILRIIRSKP
ncbi:MAG: hypothetical protein MPEBLZ_02671 [Candidatus Methanoperedens nitroreducens]|uniref:Uncharacterized protein n=2 Tax=Candidatus Methanoperedens TaxID=1392997 RepID=A0A0P7ZGI6_9EURY|nr:MAG: hypothetical protein MPEBLZ_02671 [Candidatus Methanoperedens sp. BLZ1]